MKDNQDKYPQLRFAGFADDWEQRKLGELGSTFTGLTGKTKEDFGHGDAKFVTYMNVFQNAVASLEQLDSVEIDPKQNEVKKGDVFFTTSSETPEEVGMSSVWKYNYDNVYLNSFTFGYRPNIEFDLDYLAAMLRSTTVRKKITFLAQGISRYNISKTKMMDIKVPVPSLEEQAKIGVFLSNVEQTITLHQRKLAKLKELKQGYLQKMFPRNGSKFPQLRFAGFADAWEERKLGDLGSVAMNKRIFKEQTSDVGDIPFYKIGTFGGTPDAFISRDIFEEYKSKYQYPEVGDILISASGSIGRTVVYRGDDEYFQDSNIVWLKHDQQLDNSFLKQFYSIVKWQGLEGSTIKRLYNKNILETKITLPSPEEQAQLGSFFKQLDNTIALHQRKLEKLQELKKGYLQKMFC
ncbi:restriction endonuclease subunit S [Lactiplantibacillus plantarum]|uniref:restriction endonuclease subunit S n=1 Tax=Lactiplantibacillus plantarum TaxID=1590 RepID=UPI004043BCF1